MMGAARNQELGRDRLLIGAVVAAVVLLSLGGALMFGALPLTTFMIEDPRYPIVGFLLVSAIVLPAGYMLFRLGRRLSETQTRLSITNDERLRTDMALRESEARLNDVLEGYDLGILIHRDFRPLYANDALARIMGYDGPAEILTLKSTLDLVAPHQHDMIRGFFRARIRGEDVPARYETKAVRKDGEEIWVELGVRSINWSGEPVVFVTASDITERKNAEEALRLSEARLSRAQSIAHLGNWEMRYSDLTLWWSDEIFHLFGLDAASFQPTYEAFLNAVHPDDRAMVEEAVDYSVENGVPYNVDHRIVLPDGTVRHVHEQGEVIYDDDRKPFSMIGTVHDITDRKEAEQEVRRSESRQRQFAADVAHELRTPLSVMRANLDNLGSETPMQSLREDVDVMTRLVEQLLAETRAEMLTIAPGDRADLHKVAVSVAAHLAPIALQSGRDIEVTGGNETVWVHGHSASLEQAMRNLVDNAIKYSDKGTTITIHVTADPPALSVVSRGGAIDKEMQEAVFSRYIRSDQRGGGIGLGLSIVKRIVRAHDAEVILTPLDDGKGNCFSIRFSETLSIN